MQSKQIELAFKTWAPIVQEFASKPIMDTILHKTIIDPKANGINVFPSSELVFNAFKLCAYKDLKVVWVGLDPYPTAGDATGICMGISRQTAKIPPTLKVLALELLKEYPNATLDYTMHSLATQGFLMLNMALTVIEHQSRSHLTHWRPFTEFLIKKLSITNTGIIYVLLGKEAQILKSFINHDSNYIITAPHPAAEVYSGGNAGFYGCNLFLRINEIIKSQYNTQINFGQL